MSTIFEQLSQTVEDHDILWAAFRSSEQEAKDIIRATTERIAADRATHDERVSTLTTQSQDQVRPAVVRRLALQELERMQGTRLAPTEDEITAFNSAIQDAETALRDFAVVEDRLRALFGETNQELKSLRSSTLGNGSKDPDLARKWLAGVQQDFGRLIREGGGSSE